jgi:Ca2+-binding EF-hand superfamily protein
MCAIGDTGVAEDGSGACRSAVLASYSFVALLPIVPIYLVLFRSIALFTFVTSVEHFRDYDDECVGAIRAVSSLQTTKKSIRMLRCVRQLQLLTSGVGEAVIIGASSDPEAELSEKVPRDRSLPLTPQERALKRQLRQIFRQLDEDGSGTIEGGELRRLFLKLGLPESLITAAACEKIVEAIDVDGDGELVFDELFEWVLSNLPPATHTSVNDTVDSLFAMIDADGSGEIDKDELRETLATLGFKLDFSELESVFREVDTDLSGTIDKQELCVFLTRNLGDC